MADVSWQPRPEASDRTRLSTETSSISTMQRMTEQDLRTSAASQSVFQFRPLENLSFSSASSFSSKPTPTPEDRSVNSCAPTPFDLSDRSSSQFQSFSATESVESDRTPSLSRSAQLPSAPSISSPSWHNTFSFSSILPTIQEEGKQGDVPVFPLFPSHYDLQHEIDEEGPSKRRKIAPRNVQRPIQRMLPSSQPAVRMELDD